jgi:8-oxo-dGTP pyrophosphatase MutT (NUDIX family)
MYVNVRAIIERRSERGKQILIQLRTKPNERFYELPGGRLNEYESLVDGLRREVFEETGLQLTAITGQTTRITVDMPNAEVECIEPLAVYQTLKGPVDSVGVYFLCEAEGELLEQGDDTANIQWLELEELKVIIDEGRFSWVDTAGVKFYLMKSLT